MADSNGKADQELDSVAEPNSGPGEESRGSSPDQSAGDARARDADELLVQLEKALAEVEEKNNKYLRLAAESENLRKRTVREVEQARKYAIEQFAGELLAVVDSLEMGVEAGESATAEALLEGSRATLQLLLGALAKSGVEQLDPVGEPFDPNLHEAMTMQPSETAEPGTVLSVVQKGYELNGRLLRPARVIVATEAAEKPSEP